MKRFLLLTMFAMLNSCNSMQNSDQLTESEIEAVLNPSIEKKINDIYFKLSLINYKNYPYPESKLADLNQYAYDLKQLAYELEDKDSLKVRAIFTSDSLEIEAEKLQSSIDYGEEIKIEKVNYKPTDEEIDNLFSKWDGSLNSLKSYVKENMHDPSSFEHIETGWKVLDHGLHVRMKYRGNNSLGNPVVNVIDVETDFEGNLKNLISQ